MTLAYAAIFVLSVVVVILVVDKTTRTQVVPTPTHHYCESVLPLQAAFVPEPDKLEPEKDGLLLFATKPKAKLEDLLKFVQSNVVAVESGMHVPLSYNVSEKYFESVPGYRPVDFAAYGDDDRYDRYIAIHNQRNGINIYDAAVWVTVLTRMVPANAPGSADSFQKSIAYLTYLASGEKYPAGDSDALISVKPPAEYKYYKTEQNWTGTAAAVGFAYRLLPTRGYKQDVPNWVRSVKNSRGGADARWADVCQNPCNNSSCQPISGSLFVTWSDYRPVTGENAWVLMSLCHVMQTENYSLATKAVQTTITNFATRLINTALALEMGDKSGAVYYSPQLYTNQSHATRGSPGWNDLQFSTENLSSLAAALYASHQCGVGGSSDALELAYRIGEFFVKSAIKYETYNYDDNKKPKGFIQVESPSVTQGGASAKLGDPPTANGDQFAVDVYTWGILVFGNLIEQHRPKMCYSLWMTLRKHGGVLDANKELLGFGYSFADSVISGEWTLGAIFAVLAMIQYYSDTPGAGLTDVELGGLKQDLDTMNAYVLTLYTTDVTCGGTGVLYANQDYDIPFGWIARRNASLASTGWQIANLCNFNMFRLDGAVRFVLPVQN